MDGCAVDMDAAAGAVAYRVPFELDRAAAPSYRLSNVGAERVQWVELSVRGPGVMPVPPPFALEPGEVRDFLLYASEPSRSTRVQVSWWRPGDGSYVWAFSL